MAELSLAQLGREFWTDRNPPGWERMSKNGKRLCVLDWLEDAYGDLSKTEKEDLALQLVSIL